MSTKITVELASKVLRTIDAGLVAGMGKPEPGKMCVEAAVCYAMGLPHSDRPTCVSDAIRALKIKLNDSRWSTNEARTQGLRRLGVAQLGSSGVVDDKDFARRVSVLVIQKYVPLALRAAATRVTGQSAVDLLDAATRCSLDPSIENAKKAKATAYAAYADAYDASAAYAAHAASAAYAAAYADAAAAAAYAAAAAAYAAYADADAAYAAYADADADADAADATAGRRDVVLSEFGEDVVQILVEMGAPGTKFLYLTEIK